MSAQLNVFNISIHKYFHSLHERSVMCDLWTNSLHKSANIVRTDSSSQFWQYLAPVSHNVQNIKTRPECSIVAKSWFLTVLVTSLCFLLLNSLAYYYYYMYITYIIYILLYICSNHLPRPLLPSPTHYSSLETQIS